jgi:putative transposase
MQWAPQHIRTYFITTTSANRRRLFQVESNAQFLLEILQEQRAKNRFHLHGFVIMPDHLHAILTPAPEVSLEKAVQFIKGNFSHRFKSKFPVWTPSFNQTQILTSDKFLACKRYIEQNPVRAGLTGLADSYVYSSAQNADILDPLPEHFQ